jgi:lipoyl(octanoyl) transferase
MPKELTIQDLGRMAYRQAWEIQERLHESVLGGGDETILLVEHEPVITLGRRGETPGNLISDPQNLEALGVDLVHSDRGGDITYHGPGQIVAYPIIRLTSHGFSVGCYVHRLEAIVIATLRELGIEAAYTDPEAVGVWVKGEEEAAKICAIGVRIRRGVSLHGLALNFARDLSGFSHIVPCGLAGRPVTSIERVLGDRSPSIEQVKAILTQQLVDGLRAK